MTRAEAGKKGWYIQTFGGGKVAMCKASLCRSADALHIEITCFDSGTAAGIGVELKVLRAIDAYELGREDQSR